MVANWTLLRIHECSLIRLLFLAFVLWSQPLLPGCYFCKVPVQLWWPVGASRVWCWQSRAPCPMHFGITNSRRASAAFPSPGWAGKTLMWRIMWELQGADYFLRTMRALRDECGCSDAPVQSLCLGSLGSRIMAQPAQPPSQAPGSQPRKRQDIPFWALNCSIPASA